MENIWCVDLDSIKGFDFWHMWDLLRSKSYFQSHLLIETPEFF